MRNIRNMLSALLMITSTAVLKAQIPRTIYFQGVLTDSTGSIKPDNSYSITFRLYETAFGGSASWTETKPVMVRRGLFSTLLGDQTPFGSSVQFDVQYWLSLQIESEPELSPRIALSAAAYS